MDDLAQLADLSSSNTELLKSILDTIATRLDANQAAVRAAIKPVMADIRGGLKVNANTIAALTQPAATAVLGHAQATPGTPHNPPPLPHDLPPNLPPTPPAPGPQQPPPMPTNPPIMPPVLPQQPPPMPGVNPQREGPAAQAGPVPPVAGWYCVNDDPTRPNYVQYLTPIGWVNWPSLVIVSGPFADQQTALVSCGGIAPPPPPPPLPTPVPIQPPPPPPPPQQPMPQPQQCPAPAGPDPCAPPLPTPHKAGAKACALAPFSRIGDANWCATLDQTIGTVKVFGSAIVSSLAQSSESSIDNTESTLTAMMTAISTWPGVGPKILDLIGPLVNSGAFPLLETARTVIETTLCLARAVTCDDPELTIGLVVLRGLVGAFKRLRLGANLALWTTIDVAIDWDQVDAVLDYLIAYSCPYKIPGVSEADAALRKRLVSQEQRDCWLMMNGVDPAVHDPVYRAEFTRPGPDQRKQWVYRLRPGAKGVTHEYTEADFALDLSRDGTDRDYTSYIKDTLYRVYQLRELRQLMDANVATKEDLEAALLSEGFGPDTMPTLRDMELVLTERKRQAEIQGYSPSRIAHMVARGEMNDTEARSNMEALSYTADHAKRLVRAEQRMMKADQHRKYAVSAETELVAQLKRGYLLGAIHPDEVQRNLKLFGAQDDAINGLLKAWDLQHVLDLQQSGEAAIKKGWEGGFLSSLVAKETLVKMGVQPAFAEATVNQWDANRSYDQHSLTGQNVITGVQSGLITPVEALARLLALGWEVNTAEFALAEVRNKLQLASQKSEEASHKAEIAALQREEAKIAAATARQQRLDAQAQAKAARDASAAARSAEASARRAGTAAAALAKAGVQAQRAALAEMKRQTPESELKKWLKIGLISAQYFTSRMKEMGYDAGVIEAIVAETCADPKAACVETGAEYDAELPGGSGNGQSAT